jgi:hypothetical protein
VVHRPSSAALVERRPPQHVPAAGQQLHVADDDVRVAGEVAAHPVQPGPSPGVGDVDARHAHGGHRATAGTSSTLV